MTHVCDQQLAAHKQALLATVIQRASTGEEKFKVHAQTLGARRRRSYNHTIMSSVAASATRLKSDLRCWTVNQTVSENAELRPNYLQLAIVLCMGLSL